MNKITSRGDEIYVLKNFISSEECDTYFKRIRDIGYQPKTLEWADRIVRITTDPIVEKVTNFLNKRFNLKLKIQTAEIQNHHVNSFAGLHVHDECNGRKNTVYNSLIYLNDNFEGGQFITKNGIVLKPEKGMLTFFNGKKVYHGVNKILRNDRKTIIFWWQ